MSAPYQCQSALDRSVIIVFVDAPHVLDPVDMGGNSSSTNTLESFDAPEVVNDPTLTPRGWWSKADAARGEYAGLDASLAWSKADAARGEYAGLDASLASLRNVLSQERYVVCPSSVLLALMQILIGYRAYLDSGLWHCR
jgi:hypothetical protein